jgi:hypothetical protein
MMVEPTSFQLRQRERADWDLPRADLSFLCISLSSTFLLLRVCLIPIEEKPQYPCIPTLPYPNLL